MGQVSRPTIHRGKQDEYKHSCLLQLHFMIWASNRLISRCKDSCFPPKHKHSRVAISWCVTPPNLSTGPPRRAVGQNTDRWQCHHPRIPPSIPPPSTSLLSASPFLRAPTSRRLDDAMAPRTLAKVTNGCRQLHSSECSSSAHQSDIMKAAYWSKWI